jgi:predicted nuclease of predicted toxin-antitoxin system
MDYHYCFDENFSTNIVRVLQHLGVSCCHITDHLAAGTQDADLLPVVGARGWILVSTDARMIKVHAAILKTHNVKAIWMPNTYVNADLWTQAVWIFKHWRTVQEGVQGTKNFQRAKITDNGNVKPF